MSGLAGQAIGLEDQSPTPIGGDVAIDPESKGSMENFIGFGLGATSYDPSPVDFDAADDTVTAASDGVLRVAPSYMDTELSWPAVPPGFSPFELFASDEIGWWFDPSDFSTMWQDSAGTIPVTAVGQPVGKILDKSGNALHATQSTAASRPALRQDAGGKYYLEFDAVDDWLSIPASDFSTITQISIFAGIAIVATGVWKMLCLHAAATSVNEPSFGLQAPAGNQEIQSLNYASGTPGLLALGSNLAVVDQPYVTTSLMDRTVAVRSAVNRVNGVEVAAAGWAIALGGYGNLPSRISGIADEAFGGKLYSLTVRGATSSEEEITDMESWVNEKTGAF